MKKTAMLVGLGISLAASHASAGPQTGGFVRAQGSKIVDQKGAELRLRGLGLGNWFVPEGYMWKFGPQGDRPRKIEAVIEKVVGKREAAVFWKVFRDNYVNENDIRRIAQLGFNSVRPALKARDFMTEDNNPRILEEGMQRLDQLVAWCRKYDLYVILDLHAAPGGQTGKNIDDAAFDHPELFKNAKYQEQCEALWVRLATHFKDEPVIAGYDLLNEPIPEEFRGVKRGLEPLYKRLAKAIRKVDSRHMILLEGANWSNDWSVFGAPFDPNLCYQFHKYWNDPDRETVQPYLDFQKRYNVPVWCGEFGEPKVGTHWIWATSQLFEDMGWGWSFWPWKKMDTNSAPYSIRMPQGWEKIQAVSNGLAAPPATEGRAILAEFLHNIRLENCREVPEVTQALFHRVPFRIEAEDFGHGGQDRAYHALDPKTRADRYRRSDSIALRPLSGGKGGYNVGWVEKGEWLQYELECEVSGLYDFSFRVASEGGTRNIHVEEGGKDISGPIAVRSSGSWTHWTFVEKKGIALKKGKTSLRVVFDSGGPNLDYFVASLSGGVAVPERPENLQMRHGAVGKLPGKVEAEDFGVMGEGRSYHDVDAANQGGTIRLADGADLQLMDEGSGLGVDLKNGEWLAYEINSLRSERLRLTLRARSDGPSSLRVTLDNDEKTALSADFPALGAWSEKSPGSLALSAGKHLLKVAASKGAVSLDWIELAP
ncbi:MAG: cellulase family glycosylhydrolase [candidate division FCPU426 bacterium]